MAKLIGTDPNQVPTNADLGTMAYQDSTNTVLENAYINAKGADGLEMGEDYTSPNNSSRLFFNSNTAGGNWAIFNNSGSLKFQSGASAGSTSGNYVSAALSTTGVVLGGYVTMPNQPAFTAYIQTRTNWTATGLQRLPFDSTLINQGSHFNTTTNRFTAPTSGRYQFNLSLNCTGDIKVYLYKNGSVYHGGEYRSNPTNVWEHAVIESIISLSANDYVEVYVHLTGTGFAWNGGSSTWDHFSGHLIN